MSAYKFLFRAPHIAPVTKSKNTFMRSTSRITPHLNKVIKSSSTPHTRNMSIFFPRVVFGPARCTPAITRNDFAPLFSLFDDTLNEYSRSARHARKSFAPRFNVHEAKESYSLEGELPGIDQKDISIEFTDEHTLTIRGRSEHHSESGHQPTTEAIEAAQDKTAIQQQDGAATPASDAASVKSHQATVEDETAAPNTTETSESPAAATAVEPAHQTTTEPQVPQNRTWISERRVGEFTRSFRFDARVDQDAVKASLKNGLLSIVVPKAAKPESRRINIE